MHNDVSAAFDAEAAALLTVVSGLTDADLAEPSPCAPWTVGELACHVLIGANRIGPAMAEPERADDTLITTAEYYRRDQRFSAATNADRIETARALARQLSGPGAIAAELGRRCRESAELLAAAPPGRTVITRHGDRMLLIDFARTRVVELALHGLDLAQGLSRQPWLTSEATDVLEELLLPAGSSSKLCRALACNRAGLIARLTGRASLSRAEQQVLRDADIAVLIFG
ncbi:MAG TPA: maleylpyruvate isomerase N-terminal domain-containing protein [Streptosporangiaceae bacterium]|nr:maleylpyruvate isomerase N-terminal domain-containing protein [Streptosporangiaceae bacterium]